MKHLKRLSQAVAPVLRRLYDHCTVANPLTPSCLRVQREMIEALEPRRLTNTPIDPFLTVQYFTSTDVTQAASTVAALTTVVSPDSMGDLADIAGNGYSSSTPCHAIFTGTIDLAADGTYDFRLSAAEGAILDIDGQKVIYAPGLSGDANLDGSVNRFDIRQINAHTAFGDTLTNHTWADGDFNDDGVVTTADFDLLNANFNAPNPDLAHTIDNTASQVNDRSLPVGFQLTAGKHNFQLDVFQFNNSANSAGILPSAALQWSSNGVDFSGLASITASRYLAPVVTSVPAHGFTGVTLDQPVASFTASAPSTAATDYTATIAWSDNVQETAEIDAGAASGTFQVVSHRTMPALTGSLTGQLVVTHLSSGRQGTATLAVQVAQATLHPTITGDGSVDEGDDYVLSLDGGADPGETVASWAINWGDGKTDVVAGGNDQATHEYLTGSQTDTVTATASDGTYTYAAASLPVSVNYLPPEVATSGDATTFVGQSYTLTLSSAAAGTDDRVTSWSVNWGDGTTNSSTTHSYGPGTDGHTFAVLATAHTSYGNVAADSVQVDVLDRAPVLSDTSDTSPAGAPLQVIEGHAFDMNIGGSDADGDTLTVDVASIGQPSHGSVEYSGGKLHYQPAAHYVGLDSFTYAVSDGSEDSQKATISLQVVEDAAAETVYYTLNPSESDPSPITGYLQDPSDPFLGQATGTFVREPLGNTNNGTLVFNPDVKNQFTYTPGGDVFSNGSDAYIYYRIDNGYATSTVFALPIAATITPNQTFFSPHLVNFWGGVDIKTVSEDGSLYQGTTYDRRPGHIRLINPNSQTNPYPDTLFSVETTPFEAPHHGSLTLNGDGSFLYTPDAGFAGTDRFEYVVDGSDGGRSPIQTVGINVTPVQVALSISGVDHSQKQQDGIAVGLNADDDNQDGVTDDQQTSADLQENDLTPVSLVTYPAASNLPAGSKLTLSLQSAGEVRLWNTATKSSPELLGDGVTSKTWTVGTDVIPSVVYLEGTGASPTVGDSQLSLQYQAPPPTSGSNAAPAAQPAASGISDAVKITVDDPRAAVDGNRDGTVKFDGSDSTDLIKRYQFWINDNVDHVSRAGDLDELNPKLHLHDGFRGKVTNARDTQDWAELRIQAPVGFTPHKWSVKASLELGAAEDAATDIALVPLNQTEEDYLSNSTTDRALAGRAAIAELCGEIASEHTAVVDVPAYWYVDASTGRWMLDLLVEGVASGRAAVYFTFTSQASLLGVTTSPVYFKFAAPNSQYETWALEGADTSNEFPDVKDVPIPTAPSLAGTSPYPGSSSPSSDYVLLVHGWRMQPWEKTYFANTAYKRLFWQNYKGRFGTFDWPTEYIAVPDGLVKDIAKSPAITQNFYSSEERAWNSGEALRSLLGTLDTTYGALHVNIVSHSMGSVVVSSALRLEAISVNPHRLLNTYVASQGATAAEAYDAQVGQRGTLLPNALIPDVYPNFLQDIKTGAANGAVARQMINFFNPVDYALNLWVYNQLSKPDGQTHTANGNGFYRWNTAGHATKTLLNLTNDQYEILSYAAPSWSYTLGATAGVGGPFDASKEVNLNTDLPPGQRFTDSRDDHSAQFESTNADRASYWQTLLNRMGL